jgi:crotonyl-CoA carboxylase/reductase
MIVIRAGTTGYNATLELRHHRVRQKCRQGSRFVNESHAKGGNDLVIAREVLVNAPRPGLRALAAVRVEPSR